MRLPRRRPARLAALLAVVTFAGFAPAAGAAPVLKSGTTFLTGEGTCLPLSVTTAYTQQAAGAEPQVGDVFYLSVSASFIQSFDCAADFFSAQVTLPANVAPAVGGSAIPICRRFGQAGSQLVFDPRAPANCPTSISFDAASRTFSISPRPGAQVPDFGPPASQFFIGQRAPQENQIYPNVQLLIPIKATAVVSSQPISVLACSVGTTCASGGVNLTVNAAPPPIDPPTISLPGSAFTSAIGARVPFTINETGSTPYFLKVDTTIGSTTNRPCGLTAPVIFGQSGGTPFSGPFSSEVQFGDLQTGGTECDLTPATTYTFRACTVGTSSPFPELNCRTTTFTTGAISVVFAPPTPDATGLPGNTSAVLTGVQAVGGHPAGTISLQQRLKGAASFTVTGGTLPVTQSTASSSPATLTATGLTPWRTHEVRACFTPTGGTIACLDPTTVLAGFITAPSDAANVTATSATLSGLPSAPSPAGTVRFLLSKTDPGTADVRTVMTEGASADVAARSAGAGAVTATATGLTPATKYFWSACFDNPAETGIEACSAVRTFTTAAAPAPSTTTTPKPPKASPSGQSSSPTGDTTPPAIHVRLARIRLAAALRSGYPLTVILSESGTVSATAKAKAGGRRVKVAAATTILVRKGHATTLRLRFSRAAKRKLRFQRRVTLAIHVTAQDNAGNPAGGTVTVTLRR